MNNQVYADSTQGSRQGKRAAKKAFTLIELLVSMAILSVLLLLLAQLLDSVQKTWQYAEGRVSQFREARVAFDLISKNLAQASLNTYWDYEYNDDNMVESYKRQTELHFRTYEGNELLTQVDGDVAGHAIAFQAPLGFSNLYRNLNNLFNARGYYVMYSHDRDFTPNILSNRITPKYRFRLMEYRPPAEENQIYNDGDQERLQGDPPKYTEWYKYNVKQFSYPMAENIVTMVVAPRDTLETSMDNRPDTYSRIARDYQFDSNEHPDPRYQQQLPPLVRLTMVAIDEASAIRLEAEHGNNIPTLVSPTLFRDSGRFETDVESLKEDLQELRINHKVFSTMVAIRSSKWSTYVP